MPARHINRKGSSILPSNAIVLPVVYRLSSTSVRKIYTLCKIPTVNYNGRAEIAAAADPLPRNAPEPDNRHLIIASIDHRKQESVVQAYAIRCDTKYLASAGRPVGVGICSRRDALARYTFCRLGLTQLQTNHNRSANAHPNPNFVYALSRAVHGSILLCNGLCYVLPVLWTTSYFPTWRATLAIYT